MSGSWRAELPRLAEIGGLAKREVVAESGFLRSRRVAERDAVGRRVVRRSRRNLASCLWYAERLRLGELGARETRVGNGIGTSDRWRSSRTHVRCDVAPLNRGPARQVGLGGGSKEPHPGR